MSYTCMLYMQLSFRIMLYKPANINLFWILFILFSIIIIDLLFIRVDLHVYWNTNILLEQTFTTGHFLYYSSLFIYNWSIYRSELTFLLKLEHYCNVIISLVHCYFSIIAKLYTLKKFHLGWCIIIIPIHHPSPPPPPLLLKKRRIIILN